MTPEEFAQRMQKIVDEQYGDLENVHGSMDSLMCECLESLGYYKGVEIFNKQDKWYA